jgi:aspartokinase
MSQPTLETIFEKQRGISRIEVRDGFAQIHVSRIERRVMEERLRVLAEVAETDVSIDFLKLTPSGMSFIVREDQSRIVEEALAKTGLHYTVRHDRSIVLVYAVNIRDEEGLIANILRQTIALGSHVDHVGDMHDRMLLVLKSEEAAKVADHFRKQGVPS